MPCRRHPGLVVEDPPEVLAVGEDVGLEREERAAAVDEVDARQPVLERDLLRAQVLLHRHRVVGAALDRRVVGDDDARRALDPADAGHDPGARRLIVVQAVRRQRAQLEEGRARVEEAVDALADRELAALAMPGDGPVVAARAALADGGGARPQVGDERRHPLDVRPRILAGGIEPRSQDGHGRGVVRDRPDRLEPAAASTSSRGPCPARLLMPLAALRLIRPGDAPLVGRSRGRDARACNSAATERRSSREPARS